MYDGPIGSVVLLSCTKQQDDYPEGKCSKLLVMLCTQEGVVLVQSKRQCPWRKTVINSNRLRI